MAPDFGRTTPLSPPLYPASVYRVPDLDAVDAIYDAGAAGYIYARDGHPNAHLLAADLSRLEAAAWGVVTGSGMGALSAAFLSLLSAGDRMVASDRLYGKSTKLLRQEFKRFGVTTAIVDTSDLAAVRVALAVAPTRLLFVETISNPLCRVADVAALAEVAHAHNCLLFVDNTFATPVLCRPLALGADFVMESLTKLVGGHSDVTLGWVGGRDADAGVGAAAAVSTWGLAANPFDCWLASRGLSTLELRATAATANAARAADWLAERPGVSRVAYPGRPDHPDFELAKRTLPAGCGHMLAFELAGRDAVNAFMRSAGESLPFAPSLGHATTTCSHPASTSHRFDGPADRRRQGITDGLVRLSVGCEPWPAVEAALAKGLSG